MDKNRKFYVQNEVYLQDKGTIGAYPISSQIFAGLSGIKEKYRLAIFDKTGKRISAMGTFPYLENQNEFKGDNNLFSSYITGTPNGNKVALACTNTDLIEIYNIKNGLIKRFQGPEGIQLTAKEQNVGVGTIMITEPGFRGYSNALANDNELWVGYVGYKFESGVRPNKGDLYPKKIYCFSWEGKPLKKIEVDLPLVSFGMDWVHGKMYALTEDPSPRIVVFDMKNSGKSNAI